MRGTRTLVFVMIMLLAAALVACGGNESAPATSTTALGAAADPEDVLRQYTSDPETGLPGVVVGVIKNGEVIYQGAAGVRERGNPAPVTVSDSFHIGSDTKAMTALLCGILVDRGQLSWSTTVAEVLGPQYPMRDEYRAVTLEQLLSHTAGLPAELPAMAWATFFPYDSQAGRDRARLVQETLSLAPESAAGSAFLYSNLGYVVAGHMAEKVTGKTWETLMQQEIFTPLGMSSAGFGPPAAGKGDAASPGAPWGHSPEPVDPASDEADNPAALGPAGTVHANLADLEKYVPVFWSAEAGETGRPLVTQSVVDELIRVRLSDYALGWGVATNGQGGVCLVHDGSNTMFYCTIIVFVGEKNAVIVMTNRGDGQTGIKVAELVTYFAEHFLK